MRRLHFALCVSLAVCGCGSPGGGGPGPGNVAFSQGFTFVRTDDVYVSDKSDYTTVAQLTHSGANRHPSLSHDGKVAVFVHAADPAANAIQTVATDGSGPPRTLYTADASANQRNLRTPVFSPDGTKVVFAFDVGTTSFLGVVNSDGSNFSTLTASTLSFAAPSFYADGRHVLAIAGNSSSSFTQLQQVDVTNGTTQSVLTSLDPSIASVANRAVLSPDGTQIALDGRLNASPSDVRIFVVDVNAGTTHQLTSYAAGEVVLDGFPTWVGNNSVGFTSNSGGNDQVYVLAANSVMTSGGLTLPSATQPWYGP